jgi:hypothetical protein
VQARLEYFVVFALGAVGFILGLLWKQGNTAQSRSFLPIVGLG